MLLKGHAMCADGQGGDAAETTADRSPLASMCRLAITTAHADGAVLTSVSERRQGGVVFSSDATALELARLQFTLGEGPTADASMSDWPVLVGRLDQPGPAQPWVAFSAEAETMGVCGVFAFPIRVGAARLGVLTLYRRGPGDLDGAEMHPVLSLCDRLFLVLLDHLMVLERDHRLDPSLDGAGAAVDGSATPFDGDEDYLQSKTHQATGMVMAHLEVTLVGALSRLRAHAYATGSSLNDVAADVLAGRLLLNSDGYDGPHDEDVTG